MDYLDHATTLKCTEEQDKNSWAHSYFAHQREFSSPGVGRPFQS